MGRDVDGMGLVLEVKEYSSLIHDALILCQYCDCAINMCRDAEQRGNGNGAVFSYVVNILTMVQNYLRKDVLSALLEADTVVGGDWDA